MSYYSVKTERDNVPSMLKRKNMQQEIYECLKAQTRIKINSATRKFVLFSHEDLIKLKIKFVAYNSQ